MPVISVTQREADDSIMPPHPLAVASSFDEREEIFDLEQQHWPTATVTETLPFSASLARGARPQAPQAGGFGLVCLRLL